MRTFWNLNREFETHLDLPANKWFANFDSKAKAKCVPCGPWIIFELNTKCVPFWKLKTEIDLAGRKWFANFDPKAKAKWVPCGAWISFQLSPKMQRKSDRAGTWIANFWLNLFVLRAESFSSFDTKFNQWSVFFVKFAQLSFAKLYIALCKLTGQIFSGFLHRLIKR